jgi:hypothetical protein
MGLPAASVYLVKVKFFLCLIKHHMKRWGSASTAPNILNLNTRWSSAVNFMPPLPNPQGKDHNTHLT